MVMDDSKTAVQVLEDLEKNEAEFLELLERMSKNK